MIKYDVMHRHRNAPFRRVIQMPVMDSTTGSRITLMNDTTSGQALFDEGYKRRPGIAATVQQ